MIKTKNTIEMACASEKEARQYIDEIREESVREGYKVAKAGYTYKEKKKKGEVIGQIWLVTITQVFAGIWDYLEEEYNEQ